MSNEGEEGERVNLYTEQDGRNSLIERKVQQEKRGGKVVAADDLIPAYAAFPGVEGIHSDNGSDSGPRLSRVVPACAPGKKSLKAVEVKCTRQWKWEGEVTHKAVEGPDAHQIRRRLLREGVAVQLHCSKRCGWNGRGEFVTQG